MNNSKLDTILKDLFPGYTDVHTFANELNETIEKHGAEILIELALPGISDLPSTKGRVTNKLSTRSIAKLFQAVENITSGKGKSKNKGLAKLKTVIGKHFRLLKRKKKVSNFTGRAKEAIRTMRTNGAKPKAIEMAREFSTSVAQNHPESTAFAAGVLSSVAAMSGDPKSAATSVAALKTAHAMTKGEKFMDVAPKAIRATRMDLDPGDEEDAQKGTLYKAGEYTGTQIEGVTLFQMIEQDVQSMPGAQEKQKGISATDLNQIWNDAGQPRDPNQLADFLKKHAGMDPEQLTAAFKEIGIRFEKAYGQGEEFLDDENVEKIKKYLNSLEQTQLQGLYKQVASVKVTAHQDLKKEERSQAALAQY